jgi:agmatinase
MRRQNTIIHEKLNEWVYERSTAILKEGKFLALIGGDHSTPYSGIRAISEKFKGDFGILHIDAHADLRDAYEGFQHSHASIMHNVMTSNFAPKKLVQVGIRDFCEDEYNYIKSSEGRIRTFFDLELKRGLAEGKSWMQLCDQIVSELPRNVYVSFDIDGFDPVLCPNTGTPVPGGLSFSDAAFLLSSLHRHGKTIIGFDLNEVAPGEDGDEWDGNVGSRILYKMCGWMMITNHKATAR